MKKLRERTILGGQRAWFGGLALLGLVGCVGCSDDSTSDPTSNETQPILIGALADQTGASKSESYQVALNLATTHMNAALRQAGLSTIRFEMRVKDSQSLPDVAEMQAIALINDDKVKGIVSDVSADTLRVNQLNYNQATPTERKVPITCYACSAALFNDPSATNADPVLQATYRDEENWLYRVFFNGKYEAFAAARIMLNKPNGGDVNGDGNFKVSVYYPDGDAFGLSSSNSIEAAVKNLAADMPHSVERVIMPKGQDPTSYDWAKDLELLTDDRNETTSEADGKPDAIYLALLPLLATAAVSAYHDGAYDIPLQAATAFRRNYILRAIQDKAIGLEGGSPRVYARDEAGDAYADAYQIAAGDVPEMLSAYVYDCAVTLMLATLKAAVGLTDPTTVDPADVRTQMLSVTDAAGELVLATPAGLARAATLIRDGMPINYSGASGVGSWDSAGDTFPPLVHWTVVNDGSLRFREDEAYDCSPNEPTCRLEE
ncbi:MAG: ABC transporter substrate-binding protein [Polyangiaceae bacterium]